LGQSLLLFGLEHAALLYMAVMLVAYLEMRKILFRRKKVSQVTIRSRIAVDVSVCSTRISRSVEANEGATGF
jgi:uncharacterized membrane protein